METIKKTKQDSSFMMGVSIPWNSFDAQKAKMWGIKNNKKILVLSLKVGAPHGFQRRKIVLKYSSCSILSMISEISLDASENTCIR